jgi:hypothetical protein
MDGLFVILVVVFAVGLAVSVGVRTVLAERTAGGPRIPAVRRWDVACAVLALLVLVAVSGRIAVNVL